VTTLADARPAARLTRKLKTFVWRTSHAHPARQFHRFHRVHGAPDSGAHQAGSSRHDQLAVSMPRKLSSLQFTIKSFKRHLERVISIEEEGGYMNEVVDAKPYFQNRIDQLEGDHFRFRERLRKLLPELNDIKEWEEPRFDQVCNDLRELLDDVDQHDFREVELLQESLLMDDGGEG
jgi:hypothetical protein